MREHLALLHSLGEVALVDRGVDWNLEIGAIARRCYETGSPAPLFTNVRDSAFPAVGAALGVSRRVGRELARISTALGLSPDAGARDIIDRLVAARSSPPIPPQIQTTAPCKDVIVRDSQVDLDTLPLPFLHCGDGGRYLNTMGMIVARTPDRRWTSWSVARIMQLDKWRGVGTVVPFQHVGHVHQAWRDQGRDMPFALALGVRPASFYAAGMPLPENVDEVDWVGGFLGRPAELVACESVDLEVPVEAEFVLEGHVSIRELELEGPMGEYGGYVHPHYAVPQPVFSIDVITHRRDAIFPFACAGEPPEENHTVWGVATAAEAVYLLREAGIPIDTGWIPFAAANGWLVLTVGASWREFIADAGELCRKVGEVVWGSKVGTPIKTIVVLEDDIDPSNLAEVIWAVDGRHSETIEFPGKLGWPMSPYVHPDQTDFPQGWTSQAAVWNCLPPKGITRPPRARFIDNYPTDIKQRVLANWESDGFTADAGENARADQQFNWGIDVPSLRA
jgi:4-hydroxy-3-polyprenylbenzoate decarboxylase